MPLSTSPPHLSPSLFSEGSWHPDPDKMIILRPLVYHLLSQLAFWINSYSMPQHLVSWMLLTCVGQVEQALTWQTISTALISRHDLNSDLWQWSRPYPRKRNAKRQNGGSPLCEFNPFWNFFPLWTEGNAWTIFSLHLQWALVLPDSEVSYSCKNMCQEWLPTIVKAEDQDTKKDFRQGEKTYLNKAMIIFFSSFFNPLQEKFK